MICIILTIACSLLSAQQLYNPDASDKPTFGVYAAEFGGAMGGFLLSAALAGGLLLIFPDEPAIGPVNIQTQALTILGLTGVIGVPCLTSYGAYLVGNHYEQDGKYWPSVLGAYLGLLGGVAVGAGIWKLTENSICIIPCGIIGITAGSVIGYNRSRPKPSSSQGFYNHFEPPTLGLRPEKTDDGKTITAVDFKLIKARF